MDPIQQVQRLQSKTAVYKATRNHSRATSMVVLQGIAPRRPLPKALLWVPWPFHGASQLY